MVFGMGDYGGDSEWRLRYIINRALKRFGENEFRVLRFHAEEMLQGEIWSTLCREPARVLEVLSRLFGGEEPALNIIRQIFRCALLEVDGFEPYVDRLVAAIRENDAAAVQKIIKELFDLVSGTL